MHAFIGEFCPTLKKNNMNAMQTLPKTEEWILSKSFYAASLITLIDQAEWE